MKKATRIVLAVLLMLAIPFHAMAAQTDVETVQAMIEELPTVEEFQAMDEKAQLDAYNRTQAAYDAYMALTEEERTQISGAEAVFEALFGHFNTLVMPLTADAGETEGFHPGFLMPLLAAALIGSFAIATAVKKSKKK